MWNFTWNTDGTLDAIEVEADTEPANGWEESINEIFQRAFVSTIEAKKVKFSEETSSRILALP